MDDIINQIKAASHVQKTLMGYCGSDMNKIRSSLGKRYEEYSLMRRRVIKEFKNLEEKDKLSAFEEFIIANKEMILGRLDTWKKEFNYDNYLQIIKRSMVKNEMNIGRIEGSNLRVLDCIEIGTLKYLSYNMVEDDLIQYINRLRRRGVDIDKTYCINIFINEMGLNFYSTDLINNMLFFPINTIKTCLRYEKARKELTEEEYVTLIRKYISYEFRE